MVRQAIPQRYQAGRPGSRALLPELFPAAPSRPPGPAWRAAARASLSMIALVAGVVLLVLRPAGPSPLTTIYAEDLTVYLNQALSSPWPIFASYNGYLQLLPRLIGQLAVLVPLPEAALVFALSGAVTASAVALFVFHASAGHIHSARLRVLLAAAVLLLPVAPLEIVDSGVNTPWYLLFALLWAALWRPRTRTGRATAAFIGFIAMASNPLALALAPLLVVRVAALRRVREHAVTAGWAAGLAVQVPVIAAAHYSRVSTPARPLPVLEFVAHDVVLPVLGWHLDWWLQTAVGRNEATAVVGVFLVAVLAAIVVTASARVRLFAAAALVTGLLLATVAATLSWWVTTDAIHFHIEPGSRYTTLAIFAIEATVLVAVDAIIRPRPDPAPAVAPLLPGSGPRGTAAVVALVLVLSVGWITDFRYPDGRAGAPVWSQVYSGWQATCRPGPGTTIRVPSQAVGHVVISCSKLHG